MAQLRHEHSLALQLGVTKGIQAKQKIYQILNSSLLVDMHILDIGSGLGGPAHNLARLSGVKITGIEKNDFYLHRARILSRNQNLLSRVEFLKVLLLVAYPIETLRLSPPQQADFNNELPFDGTY